MARASTAYLVKDLFLLHANELLEVLFDQMPSGIVPTNTDFHLHFNATRVDCFKNYSSTTAQYLRSKIFS
jgi:hypothetical protein